MPGQRLRPGEHGIVTFSASKAGRVTAMVHFRAHDGRLYRIRATDDSKTAARRRALAEVETKLLAGPRGQYDARTRFAAVADEWLAGLEELVEAGRRSPSTVALYKHVLNRNVLPAIGGLTLTDLSTVRLEYVLHELRRKNGYATAKVSRAITSGICSLAVRRGGMRSNPVREVSSLEKEQHEARALTVAETVEWLTILDQDPYAVRKDLPDLTRFLLGTGLRIGEAVGVHWEDVDLDQGILHVRRTVIRVPGQGMFAKKPKSRSGERVLSMPAWLVSLLRERRAAAPDALLLFPDAVGGYRDRNNVEKDFRKVRAGTPFEWVVPHTYRKTVATVLDAEGLSARIIADQLGHSRISMTQDVYMGRRAVDPSAAAALDRALLRPDS